MLMSDEAMIAVYAERFLTGHYERPEAPPAPA
jgi:hypothetical protein